MRVCSVSVSPSGGCLMIKRATPPQYTYNTSPGRSPYRSTVLRALGRTLYRFDVRLWGLLVINPLRRDVIFGCPWRSCLFLSPERRQRLKIVGGTCWLCRDNKVYGVGGSTCLSRIGGLVSEFRVGIKKNKINFCISINKLNDSCWYIRYKIY